MLATTPTLLLLLAGGGPTCALSVTLLLVLLRLDINIVLYVKFVVDIHYVYFETSSLSTVRLRVLLLLLLATADAASLASSAAVTHSLRRGSLRHVDSVCLEELLLLAHDGDPCVPPVLLV